MAEHDYWSNKTAEGELREVVIPQREYYGAPRKTFLLAVQSHSYRRQHQNLLAPLAPFFPVCVGWFLCSVELSS